MLVEDNEFDATYSFGTTVVDDDLKFDHKPVGIDLDLIGGYDFGMIRAEVEAGYKRSSLDEIDSGLSEGAIFENSVDGNVRVYSVMANVLLDFGPEDGWNGYVGGGVGAANVRYKINLDAGGDLGGGSGSDSDRSLAYQGIAGVRKAITDNIDLGIKYRYFIAPNLNYDIDFGELRGKFKSHSVLASLVYNFGAPAVIVEAAPPPPPPPPLPPPELCSTLCRSNSGALA